MDLKAVLRELARLRKVLEEINETRAQLEAKLAETPEALRIEDFKQSAKKVAAQKEALEHEIKDAARELWQPGQPKEIIRGVKVRESRFAHYDTDEVIAWAQEWAKVYIKPCKGVLAGILPDVPASVVIEVSVALDRDLGDYLTSEMPPEPPRMVRVEDEGKGHDKT